MIVLVGDQMIEMDETEIQEHLDTLHEATAIMRRTITSLERINNGLKQRIKELELELQEERDRYNED